MPSRYKKNLQLHVRGHCDASAGLTFNCDSDQRARESLRKIVIDLCEYEVHGER